ncbi:hypothetical protein HanIR_Chr17g0896501 [Helianthus annuus]|nr:hypothetical protein HanIR_Chr17g0896501 [Helianthus annuus]
MRVQKSRSGLSVRMAFIGGYRIAGGNHNVIHRLSTPFFNALQVVKMSFSVFWVGNWNGIWFYFVVWIWWCLVLIIKNDVSILY